MKNMIQYISNKKLKITVLLLATLTLSLSCDDILDEQPKSEIVTENFWKNNNDATSAVVGMYDAMQPTYRQNHFLWGEFRTDNYTVATTGATIENIELVLQNVTPGNRSTLKWNNLYDMINRANQCIKYIPTINGYNRNLLAEAHAIRAFAYFDAVRVWGAVPLYTTPTESISVDLRKPRTPSQIILTDVVIPDMIKAEELMITSNSNFRFSKASILCLQANVYMWTKEYNKAKIALDKMIAIGGHSLVNTVDAWEDLFYNTPIGPSTPTAKGKKQIGSELIFSIRFDLAEEQGGPGGNAANRSGIMGLFNAGVPSFLISKTLETKWRQKFPIDKAGWEAKYPGVPPAGSNANGLVYGDWRYFLCRQGGYDNNFVNAAMAKYTKLNFNVVFDDTDIVIYRYAGMLLLLAEAENQLNADGVRALAIVNQIRTARKLPLVKSAEFGATKNDRENYILDERQLELLGEGQRWWDLRRTGKALEVLNPILGVTPNAVQLTNERLLFPVYFEHLIENPKLLPQNSGY